MTYAVVNDTPLRLDVVAPDDHGNSRRAGVIVLHGGAWRSGDKADVHDAAEMLAAHGFVAFAVNYRKTCARHEHGDRLCGVHVSQSVDDTYRALDWIRSHAARFGAAPRRVGVLGMSAGGHLAEMLGVRARRHRGHVDAVVAWSAPLPDLREFNSDPHPLRMVGCRPEECPLRWAAISPDTYASPGDAPTMIVNSTAELVPRQSATYLALKLRYAHVPVRLLLLPGTRHASQYASVAWGPTLAFLRKWLRPQAHQ